MSKTWFQDHSVESAPERSRPALKATAERFGFIPSAMARLAESPAAVGAFGRLQAIWDATSLSHDEREVVAMTVSHDSGCRLCLALHTALLSRSGMAPEVLDALRANHTLPDGRLEAVRRFTQALLARRGAVTDSELQALLDAGFNQEQALEMVVGVSTYVLSTFANRLTRASVNQAFMAFAPSAGE